MRGARGALGLEADLGGMERSGKVLEESVGVLDMVMSSGRIVSAMMAAGG